jgi:hypothetical protein
MNDGDGIARVAIWIAAGFGCVIVVLVVAAMLLGHLPIPI